MISVLPIPNSSFLISNLKVVIFVYILETDGLIKEYSHVKVVDGVSLKVEQGDIYGFVGKNGAGKTTFIRMVLGLTGITDGSFKLFEGESLKTAKKRVGSLIESPALFKNMTAKENLDVYCTMLGADKKTIPEILETVGLSDTGRKKAGDFSLGMKQRLGIALALVGNPDFLILDEPINGLDPTGIVDIREMLLRLKEQGKTIFISSHILGELEKMATRYGIISGGKLVEEISAEELAEKCGSRTVIKVSDTVKASSIILKFLEGSTDNLECEKNSIFIKAKIENIGELTNALFNAGIVVSGITTDENSAERYFINKMEG